MTKASRGSPLLRSPAIRGLEEKSMTKTPSGAQHDVPLVPASQIGLLLYPWAVQLILQNPPENDNGKRP